MFTAWQDLIVLLAVAVSAGYVIARLRRLTRRRGASLCDGCPLGSCPTAGADSCPRNEVADCKLKIEN